ncbi:MAG: 2-oxoglutarate dehydrogenase complex dihydrolipoyllysine-residue succinyltransferase [Verrucomicrobiae bacterium]|nr:2-oxoglutarate dehydrogenase complex dihydrolipoyllysine-residue succinyltransferase [Verrucomicrobiae bacterium]
MAVELKVPAVGESITEVEIGDWLKAEGAEVRRDENVVVLETEKATVELPAPVSGKLSRVLKKKGERAGVGEVLAYIEESAISGSEKTPPPSPTPHAATAGAEPRPGAVGEPRVMPAAARLAAEHKVDVRAVTPTGPGGRVLKEDVQRVLTPTAPPVTVPPTVLPATPPVAVGTNGGEEEVVPMTPLRRRIAERLVQAQQTTASLTTFNEIDMSEVIALRQQHQEAFQARYGVRLGFMSFFVKAVIDALKQIPQLNASIRGTDIVYHHYYHIGIAVGGGRGLVVPVLRNADRMSFAEIEQAIADFAARAKDNKLKPDELQGGTFTITNGGVYGSMLSTPILNPPQSGILGMHAIQERPVARAGQVVIRPMMYVALTYDHRLVDGREAVTFLRRVKECIEAPARMLVEV